MKRLISFLLAMVLICSSLPMYVGAEETTGGYKLEYDRIGEDTYKIYIIGDKINKENEFRLYYDDVEVVSYQWNKEVSEGNFAAAIANDLVADKYVVFCCATFDEKGLEVDAEYIAEVVIKTNSVNQTVSLVDGSSVTKYDEITLDNMTPILSPTPEVIVSAQPTETLEPTPGPNYETGDVDGNGSINAQDALLVLKYAAKLVDLSETQFKAANVDKSDNANATDALYILQYAAKIIVRFAFTPEENIPIIKAYIKENGVIDETGNYVISEDYTKEEDNPYTVEVDSFTYNEKDNSLTYKYEVAYSDESGEYSYSNIVELREKDCTIKFVYSENSEEMELDIDLAKTIENSKLRIDDELNENTETNKFVAKLKGSPTHSELEQFENDKKVFVNANLHMALLSMEDYLQNTVVVCLKDLGFTSYSYSEEQLYDVIAFLYGIDVTLDDNIEMIKNIVKSNGKKEEDEYVLSELGYSGGVSGYEPYVDGYNRGDTYLIYNSTEDVLYLYGVYKPSPSDHFVEVFLQPYSDRYTYCYAVLYDPYTYEELHEVELVIKSNEIKCGSVFDFECLYPENSQLTKEEKYIMSYGVYELVDSVGYILLKESQHKIMTPKLLGYINM